MPLVGKFSHHPNWALEVVRTKERLLKFIETHWERCIGGPDDKEVLILMSDLRFRIGADLEAGIKGALSRTGAHVLIAKVMTGGRGFQLCDLDDEGRIITERPEYFSGLVQIRVKDDIEQMKKEEKQQNER